jgi:hypothetical protein
MQAYKRDIYKFIEHYFQDIDEISEFHLNFFLKNNIKTIDLNMLVLHKFIFQAFHFLKTNSGLYFSRFVNKLYKDIDTLIEFLDKFEKKSKILNNIFENEFLIQLPEYTLLKAKITESTQLLNSTSTTIASLESQIKFANPKTKEEESEIKRLRGKLVDAIHNNAKAKDAVSKYTKEINQLRKDYKDTFFEDFVEARKSYLSKLRLVINTKLYYLNKKMWLEANSSIKTKTYLADLGIKYLDLKIYIHNYLKHIDIARSQNYDKYEKMEEVLKELDE